MNTGNIRTLIYLTYLGLLILGLQHHEMWRDEYEEYLQARDAEGLFGLGNTMSQGHAMLWQGCLWIITRFTHNPVAMQIFHGLIAACSAWLLLFKSPFKLWQSSLLLGSYFFLFEYAVISRCYAFGVLFLLLFALNYAREQQLTLRLGVILFLLANTSIYAMMLTAILVYWLFFLHILLGDRPLLEKLKENYRVLLMAGAGILLAYLQIRPQEDSTFPLHRVTLPFDQYRFDVAITQFFSAFVPICRFAKPFFWNTNFLMDDKGLVSWYLPALAMVIVTLPFIKNYRILLLWLSGVLLVLFFQYHTGFRFARYYGHFFLWWLLCMWLLTYPGITDRFTRYAAQVVFGLVILAQLTGGVLMYRADWTLKFSRGKEVADYLRKEGYQDAHIFGTVDFALSPLAAELDRKIYHLQHMAMCSYTKWDRERRNSMYREDFIRAIGAGKPDQEIILVATHPIPELAYFEAYSRKDLLPRTFLFEDYKVTSLARFKPGIEYYEGYWVFRFEKNTEGSSVAPPK